jgi:hypothetical protein
MLSGSEGDTIIMSLVEIESDWREHWKMALNLYTLKRVRERQEKEKRPSTTTTAVIAV